MKTRVAAMPLLSRARTQPRMRWRRPGAAGSRSRPATAPLCAIWTPRAPSRSADAGERVELRVAKELLAPPRAGARDPAQQGRVARGHGPPQLGAQPLEGAYVALVVRGDRQGEGVHGRAPAQGAAHDDEGRQAGAEDLQHPPLALGEERRAGVEHQRVAGQFGAHRQPGDGAGRQPHPVGVRDRAHDGDDITGGAAHAEAHRDVAGDPQLPSAGRLPAPRRAFRHGQGRRAGGLRAVARQDGEPLRRGTGQSGELGPAAHPGHREGDQAGAPAAGGVEEDALEELAVVAGGVPGAAAGGGRGHGRPAVR